MGEEAVVVEEEEVVVVVVAAMGAGMDDIQQENMAGVKM